jgi:hypothetical protein
MKDCGGVIDTEKDETLCGYDNCVKCCGDCMHRTRYSPKSAAGKKRIAQIHEVHNMVLGEFFGKL